VSAGAGCERVLGRLDALADGGLAPLEAARDRGHLEACDGCARAIAAHERFLARLRGALAAAPAEVAEAARVSAEVLRAVELQPRPRGRPGVVRAAAAAAGLLLAARVLGQAVWPAGLELAGLEPVLERLPSWSGVLRGVEQLGRWIS
jgi:anti-sigma factor RsiW